MTNSTINILFKPNSVLTKNLIRFVIYNYFINLFLSIINKPDSYNY